MSYFVKEKYQLKRDDWSHQMTAFISRAVKFIIKKVWLIRKSINNKWVSDPCYINSENEKSSSEIWWYFFLLIIECKLNRVLGLSIHIKMIDLHHERNFYEKCSIFIICTNIIYSLKLLKSTQVNRRLS